MPLHLHAPVWARTGIVVVALLIAGLFLTEARPTGGPSGVGGALVLCLALVLGWRPFRLAAIGSADGRLVVRNHWRDRTLHRDDVVEVTVRKVAGAPNRSVHLALLDGSTVTLDVTEAPSFGPFLRRLETEADAVRAWVGGRPQPFR